MGAKIIDTIEHNLCKRLLAHSSSPSIMQEVSSACRFLHDCVFSSQLRFPFIYFFKTEQSSVVGRVQPGNSPFQAR